jgi:hypothetical protein
MFFLYIGFVVGIVSAIILIWLATEKKNNLWREAKIVYLVVAAFVLYHSGVYLAVFLGFIHAPVLSDSLYSLLLRPATSFLLGDAALIALLHRRR